MAHLLHHRLTCLSYSHILRVSDAMSTVKTLPFLAGSASYDATPYASIRIVTVEREK